MWPFKKKKKNTAASEEKQTFGSLRRRFNHLQLERRKAKSHHSSSAPMIERRHRTQRRQWNIPAGAKRGAITIGVALTILFGLYIIFFSSFFTIEKVRVEKNGNALAAQSLEPYLSRIKNHNILFFDTISLAREITSNFPNEILLVRLEKDFPNSIIMKIDEHPAVANVQIITPDVTQKFVVNQIGYALTENTEQKQLPILSVKSQSKMFVHTIIFPKETIILITDTINNFKEIFGMKIPKAEWLKVERELHLTTEKDFEVWIDLTWDTDKQLRKLKDALPQLNIYKTPLQYIDLRIAGAENEKVFFKRK